MDRHKVQDNADPLLVAGVDKLHKLVRRAVAAGGRKKASGLVAPAAVKRVLGQGHKLDMGEAVLLAVGGQQVGQLGVGVPAAVLLLPPAAGVDGTYTSIIKDGDTVGLYKFVIEGIEPYNMEGTPWWYYGIYPADADFFSETEPEPIYKQLFEQPQTEGEEHFIYPIIYASSGTFD